MTKSIKTQQIKEGFGTNCGHTGGVKSPAGGGEVGVSAERLFFFCSLWGVFEEQLQMLTD